MLIRQNQAGMLLRNDQELELQLNDASLGEFNHFLSILPTREDLESCRELLLDFSGLKAAYPSTAAVLVAWFRSHEAFFNTNDIDISYDPPNNDNAERWLDSVGFTHHVLNDKVAPKDLRHTMVLHEIAPGAKDASDMVVDDVDLLIKRNKIRIAEETLSSLRIALSEVAENITRHAHISTPAFACAQVHPWTGKFSLCVADTGIGLAESFRNAPYAPARRRIENGESPLDLAIEPLMSSKYGMGHSGYGLFYASELCALTKGTFSITSGGESLIIYPDGRYKNIHSLWNGTIVQMLLTTTAMIDASSVWKKLPYLEEDEPRIGYTEFPTPDCFRLNSFGERLLMRDAGARALDAAWQYINSGNSGLVVSLEGITVMTPSFADEFFGGLFSRLGAELCRNRVSVVRPDRYTQSLIEMVLKHRAERT
jgi:anti-sigma regulatory factor (Ser/Thr protein kinase)